MAIYEYFCSTCKTRFERRRPMSEAAVATTCDHGHPAERTITAFAMVKGDGDAAFDMLGGGEMPAGGGCACGGACACAG